MATAEIAFNAKIHNLEKTFEEEKESIQRIVRKSCKISKTLQSRKALVKKYEKENNTALEKEREKLASIQPRETINARKV